MLKRWTEAMLKIISMLKLASNCRLYYKHLLIQINIKIYSFMLLKGWFFFEKLFLQSNYKP